MFSGSIVWGMLGGGGGGERGFGCSVGVLSDCVGLQAGNQMEILFWSAFSLDCYEIGLGKR